LAFGGSHIIAAVIETDCVLLGGRDVTDIDLTGKTAIVTGGGRDLGRSMTIALTGAGANVAAAMHIADDADKIAADCADLPGDVHPIIADIRDPAACGRIVAETIETFGALHMLVNNAGVGMLLVSDTYTRVPTRFWEVEVETWRRIIDTNVNGAFQMAREVVPHLLAQGWGRIVNVTTSVHTMQCQGYSPYGSSKAAMEALTGSWAGDLDGTGVTVNVLIPGGAADTNLLPGNPGDPGRSGADGKLLDPAVMQAPIVWLASDHSNQVTGQRFIGNDWDAALATDGAAANAAGPAGFAPRPKQ
jgi:3-oxoacyl-[acyl-carrier protein] reductase